MNAKQQAARDRAKELQEQLTARIDALTTSSDWTAALEVASRFHRYSFNNVMLIMMQNPDATRVAGFRKWQEFGRAVRKGEKAIRILAPLAVKRTKTDEATGEESEFRALVGFRSVAVFDVSQTDGDPLPDMMMPERLTGDAPERLIEQVSDLILSEGFDVTYGGDRWGATKNGETDYGQKVVTIREGLDSAQTAKTLIHELAHVQMHRPSLISDRSNIEVEAESVAYVVGNAVGLDTADYTLPYVAHWAAGDADKVRATGTRVVKAAHVILEALEPSPSRVEVAA